ncbi:MAG: lipocalin-like domain-containing protein [Muribaculaceae bacterium]|nr:lipocalin-like domain-containing protein [Muribaculaceae bacterium]
MKRFISITTVLITTLWLTTSCTHNNGDIGIWFGTWKITSIERNGETVSSYRGNMFFLFQTTMFEMREAEHDHFVNETFGQWSEENDILTISFPDAEYQPLYTMTTMGFTATNHLKIISRSSSHVTLQLTTTDCTYTYYLKKWG